MRHATSGQGAGWAIAATEHAQAAEREGARALSADFDPDVAGRQGW